MPALLFMHGGYWTRGYKDWMGFMAPAITCLPAIFISVGYRLAPEAKFPAPVEDCRNALKWAYDNIARFGGDPNRLFIGGHSAGGHLASLVTLQRDALTKLGMPQDVVKGCFPVSGVYDLSDIPPDRRAAFLKSDADITRSSPLSHVAGNRVPFYVTVAENDFPNLRSQYTAMVTALKAQPGPVEAMEFKGRDHFTISIDTGDMDGAWARTVRQWMAHPPIPTEKEE